MTVLLFLDVAYFLVVAYRPVKDPHTGRITYRRSGREWVKSDLWDPVQREHAHNLYLSMCPGVSQADRDRVASEWAHIRHAREAEEAKREERKRRFDAMVEENEGVAREVEEAKREKKRRMDAMVEESEGVAWNIAKAEKGLKEVENEKETGKGKDWMNVVMG